jgi:hypothetical protein
MDAISDRFSMLSGVVTSLAEVREVIGHPKAQIAAKVIGLIEAYRASRA